MTIAMGFVLLGIKLYELSVSYITGMVEIPDLGGVEGGLIVMRPASTHPHRLEAQRHTLRGRDMS